MKALFLQISVCLLAILFSGSICAQEAEDSREYHPFMSDKFNFGIGGFWPLKSLELRADGTVPGVEVDFDETFGIDETESTTSLEFRWRFSKNWSLWGQYWAVGSDGGAILENDLEWEDVIFEKGTFANASLDTSISRVFFGRTFRNRPGREFGLGAGIHLLEFDGFIEGEIKTGGGTTGNHVETIEASFPLPDIGAWYMYSWSPKWLVEARIDWLSVSYGDYSGGLWNAQLGVNYQLSRTIGVGFALNNFNLDVDVNKSDWHGRIETQHLGPSLSLTASW